MPSNTFLYFAYGSNLLTRRIHMNNPSAVRVGVGKLKNHRLDFEIFSNRWKGCSATVTPHDGFDVWGALWEISVDHLPSLDKQESVDIRLYYRTEVDVETPIGETLKCFVYQHVKIPDFIKTSKLPVERQPSLAYVETILTGAEESGLPETYVKFLKKIAHNGYNDVVHYDRV